MHDFLFFLLISLYLALYLLYLINDINQIFSLTAYSNKYNKGKLKDLGL